MTEQIKKTLKDNPAARWLVMILVSGLTFGTYWFQDFFSGIKPLMESQLGYSSTDFGMIISLTTIANCCGMIMVGGMFLDKFGIRLTGIVFGLLATLGAAVSAIGIEGVISDDPDTMLTIMIGGRVMFGVGLEVVCVLVTRTIVKWFKGHELALAMALNMAFGRAGTALGTIFSPGIGKERVATSVTFAATIIGVGFILFLIYLIFDVKIDRQLDEGQPAGDDEKFKFSDLLLLVTDKSFIFITLLCVAFYSAVFPFIQYAPDFLINKYGFTLETPAIADVGFFAWLGACLRCGPYIAGLIPLGTILFTPVFGTIVEKKGKAASLMMLGSFLLIFAHVSMSLFDSVILGYLGLLALGVAFSLVPAAMWPSVAKIVPEYRLGTAYASMFTVQNWGLLSFFFGIGKVLDMANAEVVAKRLAIREGLEAQGLSTEAIATQMREVKRLHPDDFTIPVLVLVLMGVISIFLAFMLKKSDREQGYGLEKPSNG